jgi:superfamily II DNA or RNA helicase
MSCYATELKETLDIFYEGAGYKLASKFYIPVLKRTRQYWRISGYFSVDSLTVIAVGLAGLIKNNGRMRLIVGLHDISPELIEAYRLSRERAKEILEEFGKRISQELENLADEISRRRIEALAWMLANGMLEIKVALPKRTFLGLGNGIFHEKLMIFQDFDGCIIAATGSANETRYAYEVNGENLTVHMSWREGHSEFIMRYIDRFEALWNDRHPDYVVFPLPEAIERKLKEKFYPAERPERDPIEDQDVLVCRSLVPASKLVQQLGEIKDFAHLGLGPLILYPHQAYVVDYVLSRYPHRAILADEVGLGKTIEAGAIIKRLLRSGKVQRVLVLAPKNLTRQWLDEMWNRFGLRFWLFDSSKRAFVSADGEIYELEKNENPFDVGGIDLIVASWHYVRGTKKKHPEILASSKYFDLIVIDEAHHIRKKRYLGSKKTEPTRLYELVSELSVTSPHVLLLTATPVQLHVTETMDLLTIIGLGGPWVHEELFETYFQLLTREPSEINLQDAVKCSEMLTWFIQHYIPKEEAEKILNSLLQGGKGAIIHRLLEGKDDKRIVNELNFNELRKLLIGLHPLQLFMVRNTRDRLKSVGFTFPERDVREEPVDLLSEHKRLLEQLDQYLKEEYGLYERILKREASPVIGLVKSVYHQRFVSSFTAAYYTVKNRIDFFRALLHGDKEALLRAASQIFADEELEGDEEEVIEVMEKLVNSVGRDPIIRELKKLEELEEWLRDFSLDVLSLRDPKLKKVAEVVKELVNSGNKVLVFSKYTDTVNAVVHFLLKGGYFTRSEIGMYTGEGGRLFKEGSMNPVPVSKDDIVKELEEGSLKVLVCSDAASEGINLQAASAVVNVDMPWNPAKVEQRIGRVDRIGQKANVVYIRNVWYPDSIEAQMYRALFLRKELYNIVVGPAQEIISEGLRRALDEGGTYESIRKIVRETLEKVEELKQDIAKTMGIYSGTFWVGTGYDSSEVVSKLTKFIIKACKALNLDVRQENDKLIFDEKRLPKELRRWNRISLSVGSRNALTPSHPIVKWLCDEIILRAGGESIRYPKSIYLVKDSDGFWHVRVISEEGGALEELDARGVLSLLDELLEVGV